VGAIKYFRRIPKRRGMSTISNIHIFTFAPVLHLISIIISPKCQCFIYDQQQLPGLLSLSTKFIPTVMNLLKKLAEEGQAPPTNSNQSMNSTAQSEVTTNGESSSSSSSGSSPAKNVPIDTSA